MNVTRSKMKLSKTILEDMEETISDSNIPWNELKDRSVLVTGATGMIGSAIIRTLFAANERFGLNINIIACARDEKKAKTLVDNYNAIFIKNDIREPLVFIENVDYIFHCAANTKSADRVSEPVDVMTSSSDGTRYILELAEKKQIKSVVFMSSKDIYGQFKGEVIENDLGYIDLTDTRSSYPESKRYCEMLCFAFYSQYGVPVKIARLSQTFGAGSLIDDPKIFAQFARSVIAGEDIILHTEGKSYGNYCYISDTVRALFYLLFRGKDGEAYNITNPKANMTVREMAELVAHEFGVKVKIEIPCNIKELGYAPVSAYKLNIDKIIKLGWFPRYEIKDMYKRMIAGWQEN